MVSEKNYSVLPEQRPLKVRGRDSPSIGLGLEARFPIITNDCMVSYTTGEPGHTIDWHSHMPEEYQVHLSFSGGQRWHYKDNDGTTCEVEASEGEVLYLPGGAENQVEVTGSGYHEHIALINKAPLQRVEQLTGEGDLKPEQLRAGLRFDNVRDEVVYQSDDAVVE
jgi:quercetin dioxygenase-like cupin family protein